MADRVRSQRAAAPLGTLSAAFERSGSPFWLMDRIQQQGLDRAQGFELQVNYGGDQWQGGRHATEAALVNGEVDFIDCDWLTLLRCRREGLPITAVYPYGRILGGLVVPPASRIREPTELRGRRIGVVNRNDKNWLLLRTYTQRLLDLDLDRQASIVEAGSKTTLGEWLQQGQLDAALVYWHQIPALVQQGYRLLVDIPLLLPALGSAAAPTTFFIFRDQLIAEQPALVQAFIAAYEAARRQLMQDERCWQRIGHELLALDNAELLTQLRRSWASRIAQPWNVAQLEGLWPLTELLQGGTRQQFEQAFAWDFMQHQPPVGAEP